MVNINKLRGKMFEKGFNVEKLADKIGIDKATLYRKFNSDGQSITIKEASIIVFVLGLTPSEATAIFFSQSVA